MGAGLGVAIAGSYIKKESVRWFLPLPLLGIISYSMFILSDNMSILAIGSEITFLVPLFTLIGALTGEWLRRYLGETDWRWPLAYALVGMSAAAVSQIRGEMLWFIVGGFFLGVGGWLAAKSRSRWVMTLMGLGIMMAIPGMFLGLRFSYSYFIPSALPFWVAIVILLGLVGWFGYKSNLRWAVMFFLMGTLAGTLGLWATGSWPGYWPVRSLLLSALAGGAVGLLILPLPLTLRKSIVFGLFGAAAFYWISWIRLTFLFTQFWPQF